MLWHRFPLGHSQPSDGGSVLRGWCLRWCLRVSCLRAFRVCFVVARVVATLVIVGAPLGHSAFVSLCLVSLRGVRGFAASPVLVVISSYDGHERFSAGSR